MKTENIEFNKVAIYCRLSEEDRFKVNANDDSNSIKNQKSLLLQYCLERQWDVYKIYSDDDFTGSDRNRPAFNELLKDAEAKKFNIVLCKTQSRFTRELELVEKYINYQFPIWGIRFISVVDNADTAVKGNKKARQINGLINEWYLEDMSDNIKAVLTNRRKNGLFIGAFAPYGYKKDPDKKGHLIIDEEAAETVREIYTLYLAGYGRTSIARELNRRLIPTPTDYKISHGERYKNNYTATRDHLWRYYMIANILTNEVYIGNLVQNKAHSISYKTKIIKPTDKKEWIKVKNTHDPIIDIDTWNRAQDILNSRSKPKFSSNFTNIFSGKVFCGKCGASVRTAKNHSGQRYLKCGTRYYAPEACEGTTVNYNFLYETVLTEFKKITEEYANANDIEAQVTMQNNICELIEQNNKRVLELENKRESSMQCLKNLYLDKVKGLIDDDTYINLSQEFTDENNALSKEIIRIKTKNETLKDDLTQTLDRLAIVRSYLDCNELSFEMVQLFIDKIIILDKKKYSREYCIEIHWNF